MPVGPTVSRLLCHILGYVYPAYQTFKAIQLNKEELHTQWLTFWIVNTYFTIFEIFADYFLSNVIPFYYEAKVGLLLWLVLPQFMGASILYQKIIAPYMVQYEAKIDVGVEKLQEKSSQAIEELGRRSLQHLKHQGAEVVRMGITQVIATAMQETGERGTSREPLITDSKNGRGSRKKGSSDDNEDFDHVDASLAAFLSKKDEDYDD